MHNSDIFPKPMKKKKVQRQRELLATGQEGVRKKQQEESREIEGKLFQLDFYQYTNSLYYLFLSPKVKSV
jgi:hypothetical protein